MNKSSELKDNYGRKKINSFCNEYGVNLGSSKKNMNDYFDNNLKLKRFKNDDN